MTANLLSRLQGLTAPDREVDFWLSIRFPVDEPTRHTDEELQADIDLVGIDNMVVDAPYTASLDAAVALCERVLPGWAWYIEKIEGIDTREHVSEADIWLPGQRTQGLKKERFRAGAVTPAIALLIAILTALEARENGN